MKKYNITVPKTYEKDGEEKTTWLRVGSLVQFPAKEGKDESFILELNMFPNQKFGVFEDKPREEKQEVVNQSNEADEIPF